MKLVAFGDSFVQGFAKGLDRDQSLEQSFVNRLRDHIDCFTGYDNRAVPGASNTQIAYDIYQWTKQQDIRDCFVFVGWTTFIRESYWEMESYKRKDAPYDRTPFSWFKKHSIRYINEDIRKQIFDTERNIFSTSKILEILGIPHCMIQSFDDHTMMSSSVIGKKNFNSWIHWGEKNNTLMDICCERYLSSDNHSDYGMNHKEFKVKNRYLTDECLHPNEQGHRLIAETLSKEIEKYLNEKF